MEKSLLKEIQTAAQAIHDKKGKQIMILDVAGVCSMTECFIIAEGNVDRHVKALANEVVDRLGEKHNQTPSVVEGKNLGQWVVLDYGNYVIHLLTPELRQHYNIENVWKEGKILYLKLDDHPLSGEGFYDA